MKPEVGMTVRTSYGSGPYVISRVVFCDCKYGYWGESSEERKNLKDVPHYHFEARNEASEKGDYNGLYYLNYYHETEVEGVFEHALGHDKCYITTPEGKAIQQSLL